VGAGSNLTCDDRNKFEFTAASNSSDDDYPDFDIMDILEDPFANLDDLDISRKSELCFKEVNSEITYRLG
jgi:hypothetical protein